MYGTRTRDNISHTFERGERAATDAAFARAAHVVRRRYVITRVHAQYMEPRGAIGSYDKFEDRYTLYADVNYPHRVRNMLANSVFRVPESKVRVVCHDVGGGFGAKGWQYVDHRLTLWAARKLGRPVKWKCERSEVILADEHGRDNIGEIELALDSNGKFLGLRLHMLASIGAYIASDRQLLTPFGMIVTVVRGVRHPCRPRNDRRRAVEHQPDRALSRRRAARSDLSDRADHRSRGARARHRSDRVAPAEYHQAGGDAVQGSARPDLRLRRICQEHADRARGLRLCRLRRPPGGVTRCAASCAASRSPTRSSRPPDRCRNMPRSGSSPAAARSCCWERRSHGQGHETSFKQILHEKIGIDPADVHFIDGDTDRVAFGMGSNGSRSMVTGGTALVLAADKVIEKGKKIAAQMMEAAVADIEFADAKFTRCGHRSQRDAEAGGDRRVSAGAAAQRAWSPA